MDQEKPFRGFEVPASRCSFCKGRGWIRAPHRNGRLTCRDCVGFGTIPARCELIRNTPAPPRIRPEECQHLGVSSHEYFRGNGRALKFVCNDCDSELRPVWQIAFPRKNP